MQRQKQKSAFIRDGYILLEGVYHTHEIKSSDKKSKIIFMREAMFYFNLYTHPPTPPPAQYIAHTRAW